MVVSEHAELYVLQIAVCEADESHERGALQLRLGSLDQALWRLVSQPLMPTTLMGLCTVC